MTRSLSSVSQAAVALDHTRPIYLIRMDWATERRIATWDTAITWNSETWSASGAEIGGISANGGRLELPMGEADPWLGLVQSELARGREITVYEHHTDFSASPVVSDAEQIFNGVMDDVTITARKITINLIESATNKSFPPTSIGPPDYNWLLTKGQRLFWGPDIVTAG